MSDTDDNLAYANRPQWAKHFTEAEWVWERMTVGHGTTTPTIQISAPSRLNVYLETPSRPADSWIVIDIGGLHIRQSQDYALPMLDCLRDYVAAVLADVNRTDEDDDDE